MSKEMKVGIFFFVGMVILGVLTFYAGGFEDWLKKRYSLRAHFLKVDGLEVEDTVTLVGVEVGKVKNLKIVDSRVEVTLLLDNDAVVREDSIARLESESLLGGKYVGISAGSADAPRLKDGDTVKTEEAADLTRVVQDIADVAQELRTLVVNFNTNQEKIASEISDILGENRENIRSGVAALSRIVNDNEEGIREVIATLRDAGPRLTQAMENIDEITQKIRSGEGTIGKLVQDETLYDDMKALSADLKEASATMTRILGDNEEDIRVVVASLKEAAPKLEATMSRIDSIAQKIESGEGTLGKLVQDDTLYKEATRMAKEARHAAEDVREQVPIITFTSVIFGAFQ
jgi:phospholipid/cholesterol/gamma-HCH transport system substrate-binding protein